MRNIKKQVTKLKAATIRKSVQLSKDDFKKSSKMSEGGYMWAG